MARCRCSTWATYDAQPPQPALHSAGSRGAMQLPSSSRTSEHHSTHQEKKREKSTCVCITHWISEPRQQQQQHTSVMNMVAYLILSRDAKIEPPDLLQKVALAAQFRRPNLCTRVVIAVCHIHMSTTVVKGVYQLVHHHVLELRLAEQTVLADHHHRTPYRLLDFLLLHAHSGVHHRTIGCRSTVAAAAAAYVSCISSREI